MTNEERKKGVHVITGASAKINGNIVTIVKDNKATEKLVVVSKGKEVKRLDTGNIVKLEKGQSIVPARKYDKDTGTIKGVKTSKEVSNILSKYTTKIDKETQSIINKYTTNTGKQISISDRKAISKDVKKVFEKYTPNIKTIS